MIDLRIFHKPAITVSSLLCKGFRKGGDLDSVRHILQTSRVVDSEMERASGRWLWTSSPKSYLITSASYQSTEIARV